MAGGAPKLTNMRYEDKKDYTVRVISRPEAKKGNVATTLLREILLFCGLLNWLAHGIYHSPYEKLTQKSWYISGILLSVLLIVLSSGGSGKSWINHCVQWTMGHYLGITQGYNWSNDPPYNTPDKISCDGTWITKLWFKMGALYPHSLFYQTMNSSWIPRILGKEVPT